MRKERSTEAPKVLPRGRGETILVVEDELAVLTTVERILKRLGYRVLGAGNGKEALEIYGQHRKEIALVLADVVMPGMGGIALCQTLKMKDPDVKMALMSGYLLDRPSEELRSRGIISWVEKPVDLDKVVQLVDEVFADTD